MQHRTRARRKKCGLSCFLIHRSVISPVRGEIINESQTGVLVRSSGNLPTATTVSILVSGLGRGFQRVLQGTHIFHAVVVRTDTVDSSLYGLKKLAAPMSM
ncbi:MAG TPA: hypothetical protein PLG59_03190 [bacterium]|nr:hypothetical protein [bacterium]HQO33638.1 hypothetical protein [bacterium]HQP98659.1 hypothetical protein [bacterium]